MPTLRIGGLAERTGTNAPTIRFYEEIGLLRVAHRKSGGQRVYDEEDVKRLTVIRRCREFGFSIEQMKPRLVENCNSLCLGGPGPDCVVLDDLSRRAALLPTS
jgi:DNA-binding transcriptional MerR regulator